MLFQVVSFLLEVAVGLLAGACLLRLYMQALRTGFANPLGTLVFALTNWLVLPLRRLAPVSGRIDSASLLAAYLLQLAKVLLLSWIVGGPPLWSLALVWALLGLLRLTLSALSLLVLAYAIMSWIQVSHTVRAILERLTEPLLRPVRRLLPRINGIDFSPLILLILLQVAAILVAGVLPPVLR